MELTPSSPPLPPLTSQRVPSLAKTRRVVGWRWASSLTEKKEMKSPFFFRRFGVVVYRRKTEACKSLLIVLKLSTYPKLWNNNYKIITHLFFFCLFKPLRDATHASSLLLKWRISVFTFKTFLVAHVERVCEGMHRLHHTNACFSCACEGCFCLFVCLFFLRTNIDVSG